MGAVTWKFIIGDETSDLEDAHAAHIGRGAARKAICSPPAPNFFPGLDPNMVGTAQRSNSLASSTMHGDEGIRRPTHKQSTKGWESVLKFDFIIQGPNSKKV